jgi:AraC-like DNA-binding protein
MPAPPDPALLPPALLELFDCLPPGVIFYAKDRDSRFIAANQAMLAVKNLDAPAALIGRTDHDFHPPVLADAYVEEDRRVMASGRSLRHRVWFVLDRHGRPGWFLSSKVPLPDATGAVSGVAGVRYPIDTPEDRGRLFRALEPVVRHLERHYTATVSMEQMADLAGLSSTHFNREFKRLFGMSPTRFLHSLRIEKARQLLVSTRRTLAQIALDTGYHDQSHFTRHFRRLTGLTPRAFRAQYQR